MDGYGLKSGITGMRFFTRSTSFALVLSLVAVAGCSAAAPSEADPDTEAAESDLSMGATLDLGSIAPGETKTVAYTPGPKYRAFTFAATKGQKVDFWVRSTEGDPVAYILKPNRDNLTQNDDANATTTDAHVSATIKTAGTYFVAMKELKGRSATLTVTFTGPPAPPPPPPPAPYVVGVTWNGEAAREEIRKVDLATMTHTLIAAIPDISWTTSNFTDRVNGRVYVNAAGPSGVWRMVGIDATTGAVLSNPPMPSWSYDAETGKYSGFAINNVHGMPDGSFLTVALNGDLYRNELRRLDPATMTHTLIAPVDGRADETFADTDRKIIYARGRGADLLPRFFTINATTGAVTSDPLLPPFSFDAATNSYRGFNFGAGFHVRKDGSMVTVTWNGELAREELRKIDPTTMVHTLIAPLPGITTTSTNFFDPIRGIVYVNGSGPDGVYRLFGIDATTGVIVSKPAMPPFTYDAETGTYHGYNFGMGFHILR